MVKKWILAILSLIIFIPVFVLAVCEDPAGKTISTDNCYEDIIIKFGSGSSYSPISYCDIRYLDININGNIISLPYIWNQETCTAAIYDSEVSDSMVPILWLTFNEDIITTSELPSFSFISSYTTD